VELRPSRTLAERISQLDDDVFESLDKPSEQLSTIFPEQQVTDCLLHLIVSLIPGE